MGCYVNLFLLFESRILEWFHLGPRCSLVVQPCSFPACSLSFHSATLWVLQTMTVPLMCQLWGSLLPPKSLSENLCLSHEEGTLQLWFPDYCSLVPSELWSPELLCLSGLISLINLSPSYSLDLNINEQFYFHQLYFLTSEQTSAGNGLLSVILEWMLDTVSGQDRRLSQPSVLVFGPEDAKQLLPSDQMFGIM